MALSPLPHPLHFIRAAEVTGVLRFGQPASLTGSFAGFPTAHLGAELLVMRIATVRSEDLSAAQAFHRDARKSMTGCYPARSTCQAQCPLGAGRTSIWKKEEEISLKRFKKTAAEEDRIFKPALSPHSQTGAHNHEKTSVGPAFLFHLMAQSPTHSAAIGATLNKRVGSSRSAASRMNSSCARSAPLPKL